MREWVIVYRDGSQFASEDGPPGMAPGRGVQGIGVADAVVGQRAWYGEHYYVYDKALYGGWVGMNETGLWLHIAQARGPVIIKLGELIPTPTYQEFVAAISEHPLAPEKSARYPWERAVA